MCRKKKEKGDEKRKNRKKEGERKAEGKRLRYINQGEYKYIPRKIAQ